MHLGQTASYLAEVFNRPEPTVKMLSRLLREGGFIKKGSRGRNAPHIDSNELSSFLIAFMCCPDSPAVAMQRLPHFASLPLDSEKNTDVRFDRALAILLDRLAGETWEEAREKSWSASLYVDMSAASITAQPVDESKIPPEEHMFSAWEGALNDQPLKETLPYFGGFESSCRIRDFTLFRIAKVVLADHPDPLPEIVAAEFGES